MRQVSTHKLKSICIIIPYFGKWPKWFDKFIISCKYNPTINWLIVSNNNSPEVLPNNIKFYKISLNKFNELAGYQLGIKTKIYHPYKICDFKPSFGNIFNSEIKEYDFWGYSDLDLVYGDIRKFISSNILEKYDIISPNSSFIPGHFCLFKNKPRINTLFTKSVFYKRVFENERIYFFDEHFKYRGIKLKKGYDKKIKMRIKKHLVLSYLKKNYLLSALYSFQKRIMSYLFPDRSKNTKLRDFNNIVNYYSDIDELQLYKSDVYMDDILKRISNKKKWMIVWEDGKLFDEKKELLYFHFQLSKFNSHFKIIDNIDSDKTFILTNN